MIGSHGIKQMVKQTRSYFLIVAALICLAGPLLMSSGAYAQEKIGLSVSPPTFEFSANPGDTITNSIRVENITGQPLPVSVDVRNLSALGEEGQVNLSNEDNSYALAKWIKVDPGSVTIDSKNTETFSFTISVPTNAQPGGRFGSVVFSTIPQKVLGGSGVAVGQEVGALIFLKIAGSVHENAQFASFTPGSKIHEFGPINFEARVKNLGNVQFRPRGTITISNVFGKTVATIPIDSRNVLPGAIRKMEGRWNHHWLFGPYTATTSLVYGTKGQIITASTSFWGFPFKIIGIILAACIGLGVFIFRGRKRLGKSIKVLFGKE